MWGILRRGRYSFTFFFFASELSILYYYTVGVFLMLLIPCFFEILNHFFKDQRMQHHGNHVLNTLSIFSGVAGYWVYIRNWPSVTHTQMYSHPNSPPPPIIKNFGCLDLLALKIQTNLFSFLFDIKKCRRSKLRFASSFGGCMLKFG